MAEAADVATCPAANRDVVQGSLARLVSQRTALVRLAVAAHARPASVRLANANAARRVLDRTMAGPTPTAHRSADTDRDLH